MSEYFSHDHLKKLKAAEGHVLKNVVYHNWINKTKPGEQFEFLEKLELDFGTYNLVITVPEEMEDALTLAEDFDAEKQHLILLHQFAGKIDLRSDNMNSNILWEHAIGHKLITLGVMHEGDNVYSNKSIMLDFGTEKLKIRPGMDGVMVEPLDEV